ncbi:MAG: hypothetical protein JOZ33_03275 [Acidobacteriaceae bacterium]|nr:hypothetical protein [Acidobacteriaceae bacterium]
MGALVLSNWNQDGTWVPEEDLPNNPWPGTSQADSDITFAEVPDTDLMQIFYSGTICPLVGTSDYNILTTEWAPLP